MNAYRFVVRFLRLLTRVFFRQVRVVGLENVPVDGPTIFAGNHPNSLIDPALIVTTCQRQVHFAAKDVLFKSRLLRVFLDSLGCVPIYRKMDHAGKTNNSSTFKALHNVLGRGAAMGIFPEGISHDEAQLAELKTGAARIAMGTLAAFPGKPVTIIPCGLTYVSRNRFRSRALVQYGRPIVITAEQVTGDADADRQTARDITLALRAGLRQLTVNAEDWDTVRVLDAVRRLYQPEDITLEQRVELARRFNEVYVTIRDEDVIKQLFQDVGDYQDRLDEAGLTDRDLRRDIDPAEAAWRIFTNTLRLTFWAPLAIPGLILHVPVGLLASWTGNKVAPRSDVLATTKLVIGVGLVLLAWNVIIALAFINGGLRTAVFAAVLLPFTGYGTLRVLERGASIKRLLAHGWRAIALRREVKILRARRSTMEATVIAAVNVYKPDDMQAIFPDRMATLPD